MSSRSGIRTTAALVALGVALAGCSGIYYDRRDEIALSAGDGLAASKVTHMIDPWPRHSANTQIAFNGERMQAATERYRHGKTITPVNVTTSSVAYQKAQQDAAAAASATGQATSATPAAAVKGP